MFVTQYRHAAAKRLLELPAGTLEPRVDPLVYMDDGFAVTLWTYYEPVTPQVSPADYANALERLHVGMRKLDVSSPSFTDRVAEARRLVDEPSDTPELPDADRALLSNVLRSGTQVLGTSGVDEQLLHGEPHPGNLLQTTKGLLFIDLETGCRGPGESQPRLAGPSRRPPRRRLES